MKRIIGIGKPKPKPPPPTISDTIGVVNHKVDDIRTKIAQCDADLVGLKEQMGRLKTGSGGHKALMERAKLILARKKKYESLEGNLQQQSFTMEMATSAIQNASTNQQIVSAMKTSVKEIEKGNKKIDLDEVEDLRERMEDVLEISDGIQEALGRTFPGIAEIDEDQLEAELDGIILDEDKSYLDEATKNHAPPSTSGGVMSLMSLEIPSQINAQNANGIPVDEFGLPLIETHAPGLNNPLQNNLTFDP